MSTPNPVIGGITNMSEGPLDKLMGPYPTTEAANLAIPNNDIDGHSYREGKIALIGTVTNFKQFAWQGGFEDIHLKQIVATKDEVNTAQATAESGVANAATAQDTADAAIDNAEIAQAYAESAGNAAAAAQGTANTAVTKANAAQATANSAATKTEFNQLSGEIKTTQKYSVQTGVPESVNGYYSQTTGAWVANSNYRTVKYNISAIKSLNLKASGKTSGAATALAVYFDATNTFISSEIAGGSTAAYYARQQLSPPANTVYVALTTNTGYINPPILENLESVVPSVPTLESKTASVQAEVDQSRVATYVTLTGAPEVEQGYYKWDSGLWVPFSSYLTTKYDISTLAKPHLLASGRTNGNTMALAVYFSAENVYLGYEFRGSSPALTYSRQSLNPPVGTKYVAICRNSSSTNPILENIVYVAPDIPAIETLKANTASLNSDMLQLKQPVYTTQPGALVAERGYYRYSTGVWIPFSGYFTYVYDIFNTVGIPYASGRTSGTDMALAVFFDGAMTYLGYQLRGGSTQAVRSNELLSPPVGTRYIALCSNNNTTYVPKLDLLTYVIPNIASLGALNQWSGKKVGWIGTSVPFGYNATTSYPFEASKRLGFTLINMSVPGQAIHMTSSGGIQQNGSTVLTKAEYAALGVTIPGAPVTPYVPGGAYNNYYRTWENIFTPENADIDLWVFDIVPNNSGTAMNNMTDWDLFDKNNWAYTDGSSFGDHRKTGLGAMLFLMDKMYTLNPKARMVLVSGSSFNYATGVNMLQILANQWKIPYIDLWKEINTSPKSLPQLKSLDGTDDHPSDFCHVAEGKVLANKMLLVA